MDETVPRGIDEALWGQLPPVIQMAVRAHYVSTYCIHAWLEEDASLHDTCRGSCKFGKHVEWCLCPCHEPDL